MIINLGDEIRKKRIEKSFSLSNIQEYISEYFFDFIDISYLKKLEKNKYPDIEIWTLYKISSALKTDLFLSNKGKINIRIKKEILTVSLNQLIPNLDKEYTQRHRGKEVKKSFLIFLGGYIQSTREKLKLTQFKFAEEAAISRATLQRIELAICSSRLSTIIKVLITLDTLKNK
jgi:transcriptional regulator with XRE-family HTH domain